MSLPMLKVLLNRNSKASVGSFTIKKKLINREENARMSRMYENLEKLGNYFSWEKQLKKGRKNCLFLSSFVFFVLEAAIRDSRQSRQSSS